MINSLKNNKYEFCLIYLVLLLFNGFFFYEYTTRYNIVLIIIFLCLRRRKIKIFDDNTLSIFVFLTLNIIISELSGILFEKGSFSLLVLLANLGFIVAGYLLTNNIDRTVFKIKYCDVIIVISVISIITFLLSNINFGLLTKFPELQNSAQRKGYFAVFSIVSDFRRAGAQRNQGIFWEPGAFQAILCLAYIYELSDLRNRNRTWVKLLYFGAMISTLSTMGILVAILLLISDLSSRKGRTHIVRAMLIIVVIIGVFYYFVLPRLNGYLRYTLITKLQLVLEYNSDVETASSSRVASIINPIKAFISSPIWGIGNSGLTDLVYVTCTPVNWFAQCGLVYGVLMVRGIYFHFKDCFSDPIKRVAFFSIFMLSVASEAFHNNILIYCLCFWGYMYKNEKSIEFKEITDTFLIKMN